MTERIETCRQAHKAGLVWVKVEVNGGPVRFGGQPIGKMTLKGAMDSEKAFILWLAANQRNLDDIQQQVDLVQKRDGTRYLGSGEVVKLLGISYRQLLYLLERHQELEPEMRVGTRRMFTDVEIDALKRVFQETGREPRGPHWKKANGNRT